MTEAKVVCRFCKGEGQKEVTDRYKNPWFNVCKKCVDAKTKIAGEGFIARVFGLFINH
ncbi:MAG: hypothetical protein Q7S53_02030 [bacterium]|nr:hypothetical protein [bacterium]